MLVLSSLEKSTEDSWHPYAKICSSQECQSKHWKGGHSRRCREQNDYEDFLCNGNSGRKKSSSIALVPSRGSCKVLGLPKKVLFPYDEFVKLFNWDKHIYPPCGLLNCGNSCFANVILQCLSCTRPLVAYLLEGNHSKTCGRNDSCFLCELQIHVQNVSQSVRPFSPMNILYRLPKIGGNLGNGRQEDAHEFMRFAIDTMQSVCLEEFGGEKVVELSIQETTLIQHIFGGQLQSQVKCTKCDKISNRYENMMDLTVEIHGDAESLEDCLNQFTGKEWLDGENMYKCEGCDEYVKAWKRLTVHRPPNVLTVALKRFQSGRFGKLNKRITFPVTLNLKPYTSVEGDSPDLYDLYAVVVHIDMLNASFFGHYICYTKDFNGNWYRIDDCKVTRVDIEEVLAQAAYMLLYTRRSARPAPQSNIVPANHIDDHRLASEMVRIKVERSETNGFPKEELIESADSINGGYHPKEDGLSVMLDETTDKGINTPVESVNGSSCSVENGGFDPQSSYCLDEEKLLEREDQKTSDDKMQRRDEGTISLSDGINDIHPSIKRPERSRLSHSTPLFPRGFLDRSLMPENGKILRSSMEPLTSNGGLCNGG